MQINALFFFQIYKCTILATRSLTERLGGAYRSNIDYDNKIAVSSHCIILNLFPLVNISKYIFN